MIYQVRANLFIANEGIARGLFNHIASVFHGATDINPDAINTECSIAELIENHHDESPTSPCDCIERKVIMK